jgi:hypothetical protein
MKRIEDVLNVGFSIQIYTKYNEDSLIKLLKPSLNKKAGSGICGRMIQRNYLLTLGDVFRTTENVYLYKRKVVKTSMEKYDELSMKTETNNYVLQIPMDIVFHIIEKHKYEHLNILDDFYQNTYIKTLFHLKHRKTEKMFTCIFHIMKYCKIHCLGLVYIMIHNIYLENLIYHVNSFPDWIERFKHIDNYKRIHCDIVSILKENEWLTNSILDKNKSFELNQGPSYYYRLAMKDCLETKIS